MGDFLNALALFSNFVVVPAMAYGSQLALGALGVTIIYGILRFSNFAHGEIMSFGAMVSLLFIWWFQHLGISVAPVPTALIALPPAILITVLALLLIDRFIFRF